MTDVLNWMKNPVPCENEFIENESGEKTIPCKLPSELISLIIYLRIEFGHNSALAGVAFSLYLSYYHL